MGKRFSFKEKVCDFNSGEIGKSLPIKDLKKFAALICLLGTVIFVRIYLFQIVTVFGDSMNPTLADGDILISRSIYGAVEREKIVVAKVDGQYMIKRVVGLPGETVWIQDGSVFVDGAILEGNYDFLTEDPGVAGEPFELGEDEYFLLGDNRSVSYDSRMFGAVKQEQLMGEVLFRMFPLKVIEEF